MDGIPQQFVDPVRDRMESVKQSILNELNFSKVDPGWVEVLFECITHQKQNIPYRPSIDNVLPIVIPPKAKIAIVGDWGTGTMDAIKVIYSIATHQLDLFCHLGDIYYAGTEWEVQNRFLNIVDVVLGDMPVLSLCGNHDVYSGGKGYYGFVDKLKQNASYFCVRNKDWQFLAMDTGRDSFDLDPFKAPTLAMTEAEWIEDKISEFKGKTILLSHHQPFSAFEQVGGGDANVKLLDQLHWQIHNDVVAWFFGHEHRMALYDTYLGVKRARCVGNGAVPEFVVQDYYKVKNPNVPLLDVKVGNDGITYNHGYAILELDDESCKASYYELAGGVASCLHQETF